MIAAPVDALGVNYYMPMRLSALPDSTLPFQMEPIPGYPVTAFGWPVVPAGLTEMLILLRERYGAALPPVYITENGCSADDQVTAAGAVGDQDRISYLDGHVRAVHEAMNAGVDVRGYFVWSLMDNFEWTRGLPPALRPRPRRLHHPAPHPQGLLRLVPRPHRRPARLRRPRLRARPAPGKSSAYAGFSGGPPAYHGSAS